MVDVMESIDQKWYLENTEGLDWENISLVVHFRFPPLPHSLSLSRSFKMLTR